MILWFYNILTYFNDLISQNIHSTTPGCHPLQVSCHLSHSNEFLMSLLSLDVAMWPPHSSWRGVTLLRFPSGMTNHRSVLASPASPRELEASRRLVTSFSRYLPSGGSLTALSDGMAGKSFGNFADQAGVVTLTMMVVVWPDDDDDVGPEMEHHRNRRPSQDWIGPGVGLVNGLVSRCFVMTSSGSCSGLGSMKRCGVRMFWANHWQLLSGACSVTFFFVWRIFVRFSSKIICINFPLTNRSCLGSNTYVRHSLFTS